MNSFSLPFAAFAATLALTGCTQLGFGQPNDVGGPPPQAEPVVAAAQEAVAEVAALPEATVADVAAVKADPVLTSAPPPPPTARTEASLDTTTTAQRVEAAAPATPAETSKRLGSTIASLGSPSEPGFWLKTPLVKTKTSGRVTNKANGKSSAVTLIPIDGPATGGSRMSLPAMRLIDASLTDLTEVEVTLES